MVAYDGIAPGEEANAVWKYNSGYTYLLEHQAIGGKFVYIEPEKTGSIARFMNHSCDANCRFRELRYYLQIRIAVVTTHSIAPNKEITVRYGDNIWFNCTCGSQNCVSLKTNRKE